jgi:hypothetical protein
LLAKSATDVSIDGSEPVLEFLVVIGGAVNFVERIEEVV